MHSLRQKLLIGAAAVCVGTLVAVSSAAAQPFGFGPGMMMGPGMMGYGGYGWMCDPRGAGLAEWRIDRIERAVNPTDAQRASLNELKTASQKAAEKVAEACPREFPTRAPARLELMEKRMDTMLQAVRLVRPAFEAFYTTLSDAQKARLDAVGPRHWGWRNWRTN
ncbi:MAG TPA: Spy/CpxP family protein refolding chaperone [Pseudolabrys sp.]|nr:Spy/CpxP family protein refolding chaperone [Pseudolabrys sp.]